MMHNAIAKCGVLKKKSGMLRRKESRFYVLTNTGGFFFAKGFAAEFDSLKPLLTLTGSSEVSLERGGSADSGYVMRITTRGNKPPPLELEASSEPETVAWSQVVHDVIELVRTINGDQYAAQPRPLGGLRVGDEGWYLEPTGRMALYTLNSHRRWAVQDRREYDEPTVLNWISGDRVSRTSSSGSNSARLGYPSQSGAAATGSSSADQHGSGSPDYPVNSGRGSPDPAPPAHPADYPSQSSHSQSMRSTSATMSHLGGGSGAGGGGGGGTWATHAPPAGPNSSFAHGGGGGSRSPEAGGTVVGGVLVRGGRGGGGDGGGSGGGGGGSADAILVGPLPVLPSVFVVGKGEGNSFGDEADSLVLRRPSTSCSANGGGGGGGSADGGRGRREEQAGEEVVAVTANNNSHGRLGRVGRWRGGGRGTGAAALERRQSGGDSGRRPLELSPGMEVLQSWLQRS